MTIVDLQAFLGDPVLKVLLAATLLMTLICSCYHYCQALENVFPVANTNQHFSCKEQMDEQYPGTLSKA